MIFYDDSSYNSNFDNTNFCFPVFLLQFVLFRLSLCIFPELKSFLLVHTELGFLVIVWNGWFCCVITEMFRCLFLSFQ